MLFGEFRPAAGSGAACLRSAGDGVRRLVNPRVALEQTAHTGERLMRSTIKARRTLVALVAIAAAGLTAAVPAAAGTGQSAGGSRAGGYNAIPSSVNGNVPSLGFEATGTRAFGDEVALDRAGRLQSMTVQL